VASVDRAMVEALADAVAARVAVSARGTVPAALLQLLRPGAEQYMPLDYLARDQYDAIRLIVRTYDHALVLEFFWHGNERLCDVILSAPPVD